MTSPIYPAQPGALRPKCNENMNIYRKLEVSSRSAAIVKAMRG